MERQNLSGILNQSREPTWREKLTNKDPDLKCPAHDAMSFAMVNKAFCKMLLGSAGFQFPEVIDIELEKEITKGDGRFMTLIGFADAIVVFTAYFGSSRRDRALAVIEAKPDLVNPMETMRQLKTYLTFIRTPFDKFGVLWCPSISKESRAVFESQRFYVSDIAPNQ